mmetsp:Transcript_7568/g.8300  ORF Transcript_7568/g.8300 Transcript_7568/m.8300 type:complete len:739 (-) Transcript_7568:110-2326(-)
MSISFHLALIVLCYVTTSFACNTIPIPANATGSCCVPFTRQDGLPGTGCIDTTNGECTAQNGAFQLGTTCAQGECGSSCQRGFCVEFFSTGDNCNFLPGYGCGDAPLGQELADCPMVLGACCSMTDGCRDSVPAYNCSSIMDGVFIPGGTCAEDCGGNCCNPMGMLVPGVNTRCGCGRDSGISGEYTFCRAGADCTTDMADGVNCYTIERSFQDQAKKDAEFDEEDEEELYSKRAFLGDLGIDPSVMIFGNRYCIPTLTFAPTAGETCSCGIGFSDSAVMVNGVDIYCNLASGIGPDFMNRLPFDFGPSVTSANGFDDTNSPLNLNNWNGFAGPFSGNPAAIPADQTVWLCFDLTVPVGTQGPVQVEIGAGAGFPSGAPQTTGPHAASFFASLIAPIVITENNDTVFIMNITLSDGMTTIDLEENDVIPISVFSDINNLFLGALVAVNETISSVFFLINRPTLADVSVTDLTDPYAVGPFVGEPGSYSANINIQLSTGTILRLENFAFALQQQPQVSGDPHFKGLKGQKYDFHGVPNKIFNLITDDAVTVNALFVDADLRPQKNKTYIGALGFTVCDPNGISLKLVFKCNRDSENTKSILLNGKEVAEGSFTDLGVATVVQTGLKNGKTRITTKHGYKFSMRFSSSRHSTCHINFKTSYQPIQGHSLPHGVLGQTAGLPSNLVGDDMNSPNIVEGNVEDYIVQEGDLFGTTFKFNKYTEGKCPSTIEIEDASLSGMAE